MNKKKYLSVFLIVTLAMLCIFSSAVFADESWKNILDSGGNANETVTSVTYKVWNTVKIIATIVSVVGIMFSGIGLMFSSASQKADAKKKLGLVLFGSILVFAVSAIIDIIRIFAQQALK